MRDGKETPVTLSVNQEGKLGIGPAEVTEANLEKLGYYKFNTETFGFFESIPIGIEKGFTQLENYWKQLKLIFNPSTGAYKGVGGFHASTMYFRTVGVGKCFGASPLCCQSCWE